MKYNINLEQLKETIFYSKNRKDLYKRLGLKETPYLSAIISRMISDHELDTSHFIRPYERIDWDDPKEIKRLKDAVAISSSVGQVCVLMGKNPFGGCQSNMTKLIEKLGIPHNFTGKAVNKGKVLGYKTSIEDYLNNKKPISSFFLKKRLLEENLLDNKCYDCGIDSWENKEITLQLDHKNGNHFDNSISNLRLLCAECHSKTDTFRGKNIGKIISRPKYLDTKEKLVFLEDNQKAIKLKSIVDGSETIENVLFHLNKDDNIETRRYFYDLSNRFGIDTSKFKNRDKNIYLDKLKQVVPVCNSYHEVLKILGKCEFGANYKILKKDIEYLNLDISHFGKLDRVFIKKDHSKENVFNNRIKVPSSCVRSLLIKENTHKKECAICNKNIVKDSFNGLELDHIDGNKDNNSLENLRFLCPNCHSQTDTYSGKNNRKIK